MNNGKSLIVSIALVLLTKTGLGQLLFTSDTLQFTADTSYARGMLRNGENLIFGTSKTGVIAMNEQTMKTTTLLPPMPEGEFRDLVLFNDQLFTITSGKSGFVVMVNPANPSLLYYDTAAFYDDLAVNNKYLALLGDPIDSTFILQFWESDLQKPFSISLKALPNEACYAASGSTAQFLSKGNYAFVSGGGSVSRFHCIDLRYKQVLYSSELPLKNGPGCGPFSVHFVSKKHGVIVGGDYTQPEVKTGTACYTDDGGKSWKACQTNGYRSCICGNRKLLFACGTTGIDYSVDNGITWTKMVSGNFCTIRLEGKFLYATSNKGFCVRYALIKKSIRK